MVYEKSFDACKAMKQYNDVPLDGKPMKITLVGGEGQRTERTLSSRVGTAPVPASVRPSRETYQPRGEYRVRRSNSFGGRGGGRGRRDGDRKGIDGGRSAGGRGTSRGGRGKGGDATRKAVSKDDLDAQLDAYISRKDAN